MKRLFLFLFLSGVFYSSVNCGLKSPCDIADPECSPLSIFTLLNGGTAAASTPTTAVSTNGFTITPGTATLITSETLATANFTIVLNTAPTGNVTIPVSSSDVSEGTVSTALITFTSANWSTPQTVTVTGVDDLIIDGTIVYSVLLGPSASADANYNSKNLPSISVMNIDNETGGVPGISVTPTAGLVTNEGGGTATFAVWLNSQPTANVTIALSSSTPAEGTVAPAGLTFTNANWATPQLVTVTGQNDWWADGNTGYTIITGAAVSGDAGYTGMAVADVAVTNNDNDTALISVSSTSLFTSENAGAAKMFTVVLTSQPSGGANVSFNVTSNDTTEGTVSLDNGTFAASQAITILNANWNTPVAVYVKGIDDVGVDGDINYNITFSAPTSADAAYNGAGATPATIGATNFDNDTVTPGVPGVTVAPLAGLTTNENGGSASFAVVLDSAPAATVTVTINNAAGAGEVNVSAVSLSFTVANWNVPQVVTVTGIADNVVDGPKGFNVIVGPFAGDAGYAALANIAVPVTNNDNNTAGVSVSKTSLFLSETVNETSFVVKLNTQPSSDVTLTVTSNDATEAQLSLTSGGALATSQNITIPVASWNTGVTVYAKGIDDATVDGDISGAISLTYVSGDGAYNIAHPSVAFTTFDNDAGGVPGVHVTPTTGLITSEFGTNASFGVVLSANPLACTVTINFASSNTNAAASPASISFTSADWNTVKTVPVTGLNSAAITVNTAYTITGTAASACPAWNGIPVSAVSLTHIANTPGVTVTPTTGLTISESGTVAVFFVNLNSKPVVGDTVTMDVAPNLTAQAEVSLDNLTYSTAKTLSFDSTNWSIPKMVYVRGINELIQDGNTNVIVRVLPTQAPTDPDYTGAAIDPADVTVVAVDDDTAGVTVIGPTAILTTEAGLGQSFTVVLNSEPVVNVTLPLSISDATEAAFTAPFAGTSGNLTFTAGACPGVGNWCTPQTVTVTGASDGIVDGNIPYNVVIGTTSAVGDAIYNTTFNPADLPASNIDSGTGPGINVFPTTIAMTEGGLPVQVYVTLTSAPTANVGIPVVNPNTNEYIIASPFIATSGTITFTPGNWNIPQPITLWPYVNATVDLVSTVTSLTLNADVTTADVNYNGLNPLDPTVNVSRNDKRAFLRRNAASGGAVLYYTGALGGIAGADALCASALNKPATGTYAAVVVDGVNRRACTTANCSSGPAEHIDWPFAPNTPYYIEYGAAPGPGYFPLLTTNQNGILNFSTSQLINKIYENAAIGVWTGLTSTWTTAPNTCTGWTIGNGGADGTYGHSGFTDYTSISNTFWACGSGSALLCIER